MGDVAISSGAPAGGAGAGANQVVIEQGAAAPAALSNENLAAGGKGDAVEQKAVPTTREALQAAAEKVAKDNPGDAKDMNKGAQLARGDRGQFAPKEGKQPTAAETAELARVAAAAATPEGKAAAAAVAAGKPGAEPVKHSAPERFSPDAKAVWDTAPEPVKAEVHRALREMESGIEKHKAAAQKYESIKDFDDLAGKNGTNLRDALTRYVKIDQLLTHNPLKGLEAICDNLKISLREVAEVVLGKTPDQQASQSEATIRSLNDKVARLEQQVGGVQQTFQQQGKTQLENHIREWSRDKPHFEILAPHIAEAMAGGAASLDDAYQGALAKFPDLSTGKPSATDTTLAASAAAAEALADQTRKGSKSITGARNGPGSDLVDQPRSTSIRDSLRRAAAQA